MVGHVFVAVLFAWLLLELERALLFLWCRSLSSVALVIAIEGDVFGWLRG